jgi:hypothetical protein
MQQRNATRALYLASIATLLLTLSGCGDSDWNFAEPTGSTSELNDSTISGSVGDGPIVGGTVVVSDVNGQIIATQHSDEQANFEISVSLRDDQYPLTITVADGTDLVTGKIPDFPLVTTVMAPGATQIANLNPFSTIAVRLAYNMPGGLSAENLDLAVATVIAAQNSGLDITQFPNPITTEITADNAAYIVKSSEVLGEIIRRTSAALITIGQPANPDLVVDALSADLVDGVLDGQGVDGADPRFAATMTIVSGQVLLESLANKLHVGGVDATLSLDTAIQQINGGDPLVPLTASVRASEPMLAQARAALDAAASLDANPVLAGMQQALESIQPGDSPEQVAMMLPEGGTDVLDLTIQQTSMATQAELESVNSIVRNNPVPAVVAPEPAAPAGPASQPEPTPTTDPEPTPAPAPEPGPIPAPAPTPTPAPNSETAPVPAPEPDPIPAPAPTPTPAPNSEPTPTPAPEPDPIPAPAPLPQPGPAPAVNQPPTVSGNPPTTVTAGNAYSFTPSASDTDNDPLTFSITGKPAWATFNTNTGRLSGTPGAGNTGTFENIQISVSDGSDVVRLPAFTITVSAAVTGSISLAWNPPTENTDNTPISDLAGYKIYYGTQPGNYPNVVTINNPGVSSYVIENLSPGTYYVVATAINAAGIESDYSNVRQFTIP